MMTEFCGIGHAEEKIFLPVNFLAFYLFATILSMNIWYTGIMTGVEGIGQRQKKIIFSIVCRGRIVLSGGRSDL